MAGRKAHAVVCAYPALGHINPLLRLSSLLAAKGIRITFVTTHFFCDRLRGRARGRRQDRGQAPEEAPASSLYPQRKGSEEEREGAVPGQEEEEEEDDNGEEEGSISFEGLPDGLPSDFDRTSPSTELSRAVDHLHSAFEELMHSLMPVPSLLISDAFVPWTHDVTSSLLIPRALFWPQSVAVFTIFAHTELLLINGINPFIEDLDTAPSRLIDFLPGVPALPASHLPYRIKPVGGQDRRFLLLENLAKQFEQCKQATWILANSFNNLEGLLLNVLQNNVGVSMKLVGPLLPSPYLEGQLPQHMHAGVTEDILQWLHTRPVSSVLYISLGSVVTWTPEQVMEVGLGLLAKKQAFLWVMRPWEVRLALPQELLKLGKIVKFAPQLQVLGHPAIGGFMSHCGWNSTLESLSMGVPILAWPHFFDQFTNCWYVVHMWKVGVELQVVRRGGMEEAIVDRGEFERAVTLLMQAEDGRLMRLRASKIRSRAEESVRSGSSCKNVENFLSEIVPESCAPHEGSPSSD